MANKPIQLSDNGLTTLAINLKNAKTKEASARADRIELEEKIEAKLRLKGDIGSEGTYNFETPSVKIGLKTGLRRNVDQDMVKSGDWSKLPIEIRESIFRWKAELNLRELRALEKISPTTFRKVQKFFSTSLSKPTISITVK